MSCPWAGFGTSFFFFNDTATTEIYTLSLHDALPISPDTLTPSRGPVFLCTHMHKPTGGGSMGPLVVLAYSGGDRKSTRLNSSHSQISYAVFCLKKKKNRVVELEHSKHGDPENVRVTV